MQQPTNEADLRDAIFRAFHWEVSPCTVVLAEALPIVLNPEAKPEAAEAVLGKDPVVVAMLLQQANSPLFALTGQVKTLRQAIVLLGWQRLRDLCLTTLLREWVHQKRKGARQQSWLAHSVATGILAETLREQARLEWPEAYITGLVHDIGRLALMELVEEDPGGPVHPCWGAPSPELAQERENFGIDHCEAGAALLQRWGLPASIVQGTKHHHDLGLAPMPTGLTLLQLACALASMLGYAATEREAPLFDDIRVRFLDATGRELGLNLAELEAQVRERMHRPSA